MEKKKDIETEWKELCEEVLLKFYDMKNALEEADDLRQEYKNLRFKLYELQNDNWEELKDSDEPNLPIYELEQYGWTASSIRC